MVDADSTINAESNTQELTAKFKNNLIGIQDILIRLHDILIWKEPFYPGLLAGLVSLIFIFIWWMDASVLTTVSVLGITVCVLDYLAPLCNNFLASEKTPAEENKYNDICGKLALFIQTTSAFWNSWQQLKETKPKIYVCSILATLAILAWIGNLINNLLLTYLIVLFTVMVPGLHHRGILQMYFNQATEFIQDKIGSKIKKN